MNAAQTFARPSGQLAPEGSRRQLGSIAFQLRKLLRYAAQNRSGLPGQWLEKRPEVVVLFVLGEARVQPINDAFARLDATDTGLDLVEKTDQPTEGDRGVIRLRTGYRSSPLLLDAAIRARATIVTRSRPKAINPSVCSSGV